MKGKQRRKNGEIGQVERNECTVKARNGAIPFSGDHPQTDQKRHVANPLVSGSKIIEHIKRNDQGVML